MELCLEPVLYREVTTASKLLTVGPENMSAGRFGRNFIDEREAVLKRVVSNGPQFAYSHFTIYFLHEFGLNLVPNFTYVYPISCIV